MQLPQNATLHNIVELVPHPKTGDSVISRIPETLRVCLNGNAQERALNSTGCELRFRLLSPNATIRIKASEVLAAHHGGGLAQILFGDFSFTYFPVGTESTAVYEITAPDYELLENAAGDDYYFHPRLCRILLPTHAAISAVEIEGDLAAPESGDVPQKRVLNYGSSITQGSGALSSRENWASRCAHTLGYDLINLGFGGGCHCEPEMADYLCERNDFDIAILETGINMLGLDVKMTDQRIEALIRKFAAAHSDKPHLLPRSLSMRDDSQSNYQGRAQAIRDLVKSVVADIDSPNLHYIEGRDALSHPHDMTFDLVHPSQAGMIKIGAYVAAEISKILGN